MAVHLIRLPGAQWQYDDDFPLGKPGGFGEVFRGRGTEGDVAVKRLKINAGQAAHRELMIAQRLMQMSLSHVVPILDAGQDAESDRYYLVMPVCEFSLQDIIDKANGAVDVDTAALVISSIIAGLSEVRDITHRDLKPANILYHDRKWKIADFGIAKFVEDSTSVETLRSCLTPTYAAPEQWRGDRPTNATDIYAFGCIIYTMLMGQPPFLGSIDNIRENHLHSVPKSITNLPPRFAAFVSHMLRKPPNARPTLERCFQVLSELKNPPRANSEKHLLINDAAKLVAETEAQAEADRQAADALHRERVELFNDAKNELLIIRDHLFSRIKDSSESVRINDRRNQLKFGRAELEFSREAGMIDEFVARGHAREQQPYHNTGWDVLAWSMICVRCHNSSQRSPYTWSASLLFVDRKNGMGFRWYEVSFWTLSQSRRDEPFGLEGYEDDIDLALSNIMHTVNVAYGPLPIDGEDEESFIVRWIGLVAKAAMGKLSRPTSMPISDFC